MAKLASATLSLFQSIMYRPGMAAIPHRDHAGDWGVAEHHATDVLSQAPGSVHQLWEPYTTSLASRGRPPAP